MTSNYGTTCLGIRCEGILFVSLIFYDGDKFLKAALASEGLLLLSVLLLHTCLLVYSYLDIIFVL